MHIHPDASEREKLLCSLFNMRKKPSKKERNSIIGGINNFPIIFLFFIYNVLFSLRFILVFKIFKQ